MIFGPIQETSKTAVTLNPKSNSARLAKTRIIPCSTEITLTSPELRMHTWMFCEKAAMGQEICLILGQVSPSLLFFFLDLNERRLPSSHSAAELMDSLVQTREQKRLLNVV